MVQTTVRRFLLYAHDGYGLGHIRRSLNLAAAIAAEAEGSAVLIATGVDEMATFSVPPGLDVLKLPGIAKVGNGRYVARRMRLPTEQLTALRSEVLAATVCAFRPDVLVADKHPFGATGELAEALSCLRAVGGRAVLGLRDVLDSPSTVAAEWDAGGLGVAACDLYDGILVYGTPGLVDPVREAGFPPDVAARAFWCGHVVGGFPDDAALDLPASDGRPRVLACAGGGEDGDRLLSLFLAASEGAPWQPVAVAGPRAPGADARPPAPAGGNAWVVGAVRDLPRWLPHVDAVVCMGGYNTLLEVAASATPAACVPRAQPRQEQLIRARAFAREGLCRLVEPPATPGQLRDAVLAALATPRSVVAARVAATLDLGGAGRAARFLVRLAVSSVVSPAEVPV